MTGHAEATVCARPPRAPERVADVLVLGPGDGARREAEALIEQVYLEKFGVQLRSHFPTIVSLVDDAGRVMAAAGCRRAHEEPLFLEQYLDMPVELALQPAVGAVPTRCEIAEIGSLASRGAGGIEALFLALAHHLDAVGARYAVATATRRLRRAFAMFGFMAGDVALADRARLPHGGDEWAQYFEHDPVIVWGRVSAGLRAPGAGAAC